MDLENFGGASGGASIGFWKHWGGHGPPGPPGLTGPVSTVVRPSFHDHGYSTCHTAQKLFQNQKMGFKLWAHLQDWRQA